MARATSLIFTILICICVTVNGSVIKADENHEFPAENWWDHATLYQVYPKSFKDTDGNGVGDLKGIESELQYLKDIGVDAFWMNPMFASPQKDDGYDISDYRMVNPDYGTMEDFKELVKKAKELDIRVLLDLVPNHSSDEHEWFEKSVKKDGVYTDYYIWHDGKVDENGDRHPPNNWMSVFGGPAWTLHAERDQYYYHQFFAKQPDLNYRNPAVVKEMKDIMSFWLDLDVAGFRVDAFNHMFEDPQFRDEPTNSWANENTYDYTTHIYTKDLPEVYDMIYQFRKHIDDYAMEKKSERKFLMTEAFASITDTMKYYMSDDGKRLGSMPYNDRLINLNGDISAQRIKANIDEWFDYMPDKFYTNWPVGSHDVPRAGTRLGAEKIDLMNTINQLIPGASITYYGDEIGMVDGKLEDPEDNRHPCRTPMQWTNGTQAGFSSSNSPWLPVNENYMSINVETEKENERSHLNFYKELTKLRKHKTFQHGDLTMKSLSKDIFAFTREYKDEPTYVVIVNLSKDNKVVDLTSFSRLKSKLHVASSVSHSKYRNEDEVDVSKVTMVGYDGVVLHFSNAASGLQISAISLIVAMVSYIFHLLR